MEATTAQVVTAVAAMAAAAVALVSVIVGPLVACHVAQMQIHASVVSANRQVWIDTLRNEVATLVGRVSDYGVRGASDIAELDWLAECGSEISQLVAKIRLLLNPTESDHSELVTRILKVQSIANRFGQTSEHKESLAAAGELKKACNAVVVSAQRVLKRERERVEQEATGETVAEMLKRVLKVGK